MPISLLLAALWLGLAWLAKGAPPRIRWAVALALTATGIPLLGYVTMDAGPVAGLLGLALGALLIRWPRAMDAGPANGDT